MPKINIPRALWLWPPVVMVVVQFIIETFPMRDRTRAAIHSEFGPHEMIQFFIITAAFVIACSILLRLRDKMNMWLILWIFTAAISCFYVAVEEISWGQHFLNWSTPEYWQSINDQQETNLHNTSSWLDQKPRLILLAGILTGGLIIPAVRAFKSEWLPKQFEIIYPPKELILCASLIVVLRIIQEIDDALDAVLLERPSEVEELYMFYFVLLYLIVLRRRIMQQKG